MTMSSHPTGSTQTSDEFKVRGIRPILDKPQDPKPLKNRSLLGEKLNSGTRVVSIEIVPPRGSDTEKFLSLCQQLKAADIDFVNIPDGARAVARMSSMQLATYVKQNF